MREREREKECGGKMDSYDVRKATNFLVLVCTGYVGLYRGKGEPPRGSLLSFFLSSSSFSTRALFGILDFPSYHQPLTLERGSRPTDPTAHTEVDGPSFVGLAYS
jgi:hypothetical protein